MLHAGARGPGGVCMSCASLLARREAFRVFAGPEASHFMAADELKNILMNYGEKLSEVRRQRLC